MTEADVSRWDKWDWIPAVFVVAVVVLFFGLVGIGGCVVTR